MLQTAHSNNLLFKTLFLVFPLIIHAYEIKDRRLETMPCGQTVLLCGFGAGEVGNDHEHLVLLIWLACPAISCDHLI